jgi:hypothetical protein
MPGTLRMFHGLSEDVFRPSALQFYSKSRLIAPKSIFKARHCRKTSIPKSSEQHFAPEPERRERAFPHETKNKAGKSAVTAGRRKPLLHRK